MHKQRNTSPSSRVLCWLALSTCLTLSGCLGRAEQEVVVFTALDREFSEPILVDFEQATQIHVRPKFDVESTKTVQLVARIMEEKQPTCDVFWNNEILHTLRLRNEGILDAFVTPLGENFPAQYRSAEGYWYGLAARARVLIINTELVPADKRPDSIQDLIDPQWKKQVGMAKPLAGTTATHAAVLFSTWGAAKGREFFEKLKENVSVESGNKQVASAVGRGQLAFGITDTDDAIIELENGRPVRIVFPDQGENELGALFIPNTLCVIKNGPNPAAARKLVEYLLGEPVEIRLAAGPSAQVPLNRRVTARSRAIPAKPLRWMEVDFEAAADAWDNTSAVLRELFATAE